MRYLFTLCSYSLFLLSLANVSHADTSVPPLLSLRVDNVAIDVAGIEQAMAGIESQLRQLSQVLASTSSTPLSADDALLLQQSIRSLNSNSAAMNKVLTALPSQIDTFNQQLPKLAENAQAPLKDLSQSLGLLNEAVNSFTQQAPELLEQSKQAATSTADSIALRIMLVAGAILLIVLGVLIASLWALNIQVIKPITESVRLMSHFPGQQLETAKLLSEISTQLSELRQPSINEISEDDTSGNTLDTEEVKGT